jgi:23S rRNA C2498 (ribose-2'-O)-methylase RlmM
VIDLLKQKRRTLLKSLVDNPPRDSLLVQVAMVSPNDGYVSVAAPETRRVFGAAISNAIAGFADIPDNKTPPSRAFKKLKEAISTFGLPLKRGESAVDLGASPGGWTHVLRENGVRVTAVDRSPLAPNLMRDRAITFITGNALTWSPEKTVDWLVCDVITSPENTLAILKLWITKKLCHNFCVTVKFKGEPAFHTLHDICVFLREHTSWFDGRQLTHNKNEVTVAGTVVR